MFAYSDAFPLGGAQDARTRGLSPEVLGQAARQALRRGLVTKRELVDVDRALAPFGRIGA